MASKISIHQRFTITATATVKFKREVGKLLNDLMKDCKIKGKDSFDTNNFKDKLKSNLYYLIDNYYTLTDFEGIKELIQPLNLFESLDALPKKDKKVIFDIIHRQLKNNNKLSTKLFKIDRILKEG